MTEDVKDESEPLDETTVDDLPGEDDEEEEGNTVEDEADEDL